MGFLVFGASTQCKNKNHVNQDKFGAVTVRTPANREVLTAVVCDGVSMCYRGELASYNTVRYVLGWASRFFSVNEFDPERIAPAFDRLITEINQNLNHYCNEKKHKKLKEGYSPYSSCTLTCIITDGTQVIYFIIGDSAIFALSPFSTTNVSGMSEERHKNETGKLTSYVGGMEDSQLDIRFLNGTFERTGAYLLCTDGFYRKLPFDIKQSDAFRRFNQRLLDVKNRPDGCLVLEGMTDYVVEQGETDDITALVIKMI